MANPSWQADATFKFIAKDQSIWSIDHSNFCQEEYKSAMFELMEDIVDYFMVII